MRAVTGWWGKSNIAVCVDVAVVPHGSVTVIGEVVGLMSRKAEISRNDM